MDYAQAGGAQHTLLLAILRLLNEYAYCVGLRNVYDFCGDGEHPPKCNARVLNVCVVLPQHIVHDVLLLHFRLITRTRVLV